MDLHERLNEVLKYSGLSVRAFANKCGINQPTLDRQIKGLRGISLETIVSVVHAFPEISSEWLMRGKGQMFIQNVDNTFENEKVNKQDDLITILMDTIKSKNDMIGTLTERIKQLEQTNLK